MKVLGLILVLTVASCSSEEAPTLPEQTLPSSGVLSLRGTDLTFRVTGSGRPCVSFGSSLTYPGTFSDQFQSHFRCVHVDAPIFVAGATGIDGEPYGVAQAARDIEAVREELGIEEWVVVGHSVMGLVALEYAALFPDRTTHVIAISPPPQIPIDYDSLRSYRARHFSAERQAQHSVNLDKTDSLRLAHPGRGFIPDYIANAAFYWADSTFDVTPLYEGVVVNDQLFEELQSTGFTWDPNQDPIQVPVFVALGRHDYVVTPNQWLTPITPFSNLTVRVFENAGHWAHFEEPESFDEAVIAWIGGDPPPPTLPH